MWTKGFMKEFHKAFAQAANERKLWWEMISAPSGSRKEIPLVRLGQGRNIDYYDPSQIKKGSEEK
ncbi:MAG: hypothetical protein M1521_08680 [Thermotogae bacterium]|nr:hypothetical protein [Thermotogota bacterium]